MLSYVKISVNIAELSVLVGLSAILSIW